MIVNRLWHEWKHGLPWRDVSVDRPTYARGCLLECPCGKRWLSRMPWDREAGF